MALARVRVEAGAQVLKLHDVLQVLDLALDNRAEFLLLLDLGLYRSLFREGPGETLFFLTFVSFVVVDFDAPGRGAGQVTRGATVRPVEVVASVFDLVLLDRVRVNVCTLLPRVVLFAVACPANKVVSAGGRALVVEQALNLELVTPFTSTYMDTEARCCVEAVTTP